MLVKIPLSFINLPKVGKNKPKVQDHHVLGHFYVSHNRAIPTWRQRGERRYELMKLVHG